MQHAKAVTLLSRAAVPSTAFGAVKYPNALVRGQLRQWKADLAERYRVIDRAFATGALNTTAAAFTFKRKLGRQRAFDRIARLLGTNARLECVQMDGRHPLAL